MRRSFTLTMEILLAAVVILALVLAVADMTAAAPVLTGSQVVTLERSDDGELYAALSIVLDLALTDQWAVVLVHDQAATWHRSGGDKDRYVDWDASIAWRPGPGWSVSLGRRWRVGPPPDYGGPWTYVQVWRGM